MYLEDGMAMSHGGKAEGGSGDVLHGNRRKGREMEEKERVGWQFQEPKLRERQQDEALK